MVVETGLAKITKSPWYPGAMDIGHNYVFRKGSLECHLEDCVAPVNTGGGLYIFPSESYAG